MTVNPLPRIAIIGKGAIGGLLAFKCQNLNIAHQLLLRAHTTDSIKVADIKGQVHSLNTKQSLISQPSDFDVLVLPVKAYQVIPALEEMRKSILPHHIIVLLHNGMGTIEQVVEMYPNNPLIAATTSYGAFRPNALTLNETGIGETHLGWLTNTNNTEQSLIEMTLSKLLPPSTWHPDISLALWKKLAINAVINPLTSIHNIKNGQLAGRQYHQDIALVCAEVAQVMSQLGNTTDKKALIDKVMQVIHATANNYSSMHQDIAFSRPTEIDYINGYVLKIANKLNVSTPLNQLLVEQVKSLENKKQPT